MTKEDYEPDFEISKRYIEFSSELLRLSLLAITGICYLLFMSDLFKKTVPNPMWFVALILFLIASCFALAHRYAATDSLTCLIIHLKKKEKTKIESELMATKSDLRRQLKLSENYLKYCAFVFILAILFGLVAMIVSKN